MKVSTRSASNIDGETMLVRADDTGISRVILHPGGWKHREEAFTKILLSEIKEGMCCLDVGANLGLHTLSMAKRVGEHGRVISIEPDPSNVEVLRANARSWSFGNRIEVIHGAVSDSDGGVEFYRAAASNLGSLSPSKHSTGEKVVVPAWTIESLAEQHHFWPHFIKMDIEGAEVQAFAGLLPLIESHAPGSCKLLVELHPQLFGAGGSERFAATLRRLVEVGFRFKYVVSAGVPIPDKFRERGYSPDPSFDPWQPGFTRRIYSNVSSEDAIDFCAWPHAQTMPGGKISPKIARSFLLARE